MATVLDAPKSANPAKVEEFVEKQLSAARRRVRLLDFFLAGLSLAVVSLAFLLALLLVDRYVETPRGTGWAVLGVYIALAAGFLYFALFRQSRRDINPYFAARQVEQTVPNAKNSLVTWVDFEEDNRLPGSIRSAIGQKAARDLKGVDLNRAIENRTIIWLAIGAGLFLLASVVVAFLPPTRTELTLEEPKKGDATVFNNQEVTFQVRVHGRIPGANDADAVRLRLWYNPEDPESYEERPMPVSEDDRRQFSVTIPPKQVRNGFQYKVLAGNAETPVHTITCKIIPEFTGFEVNYQFPPYLKLEPETRNDPNLLAYYGSTATLIVSTNREVKHGHIEIEGQTRTIDGQLIEGRPDAIQFTLTLEKEGFFRVWFTTPEGDKNQDPARLRLGVIDPKPVFRTFDIDYQYPAYLRYKLMSVADAREPEIEGPRGTTAVLTAKATREVKDAKLELEGMPAITGEPVPEQPTWVRFKLPPIEKDGMARVSFTPTTTEAPSTPRSIPIRAIIDQLPQVQIDKPKEDMVEIPANGTLELHGLATDDHGVDKLTLRMKLIDAEDRDLVAIPYRGGMSFFRKEDNSWPTRVEYKDFVKLPELRMDRNTNWRIAPNMEIEYWLEAKDNCDWRGPNVGVSKPKRFKVAAAKVPEQKDIDQRNRKLENERKAHEKKQDDENRTQKRDVKQDPPKGAEKQPGDTNPQDDAPQPRQVGNPDQRDNPPSGDPSHEQRTKEAEEAIKNAAKAGQPGHEKPNTTPETKVDPNEGRREPGKGPTEPPKAEDRTPKNDPNNMDNMGNGPAGASRGGNVDQTPEEKGAVKEPGEKTGMSEPEGGDKPSHSFGGEKVDKSGEKPDAKDRPAPKTGGTDQPTPPEKGTARKEPSKTPDPKDPKTGDRANPGEARPEKDTTASDTKKGSSEPGPQGDTPPDNAGATKPQKSPDPGGARPEPKKEQVTDKGGTRSGPQDEGAAGGAQPPPKAGMNEEAKGGPRGGPSGPQQPKNSEQGDLERELGELEREINSPNPEVSENAKATANRLMRNPKTREKTKQKLDELKRNSKDELAKKKADDLRNSGDQAANNYDQEKPNQENVDTLSKKLNSKDQRERQEAEDRVKDWEKDPQNKKDLEAKNDELRKKDPAAAERVDNAMKKAEQARAGNSGQPPKLDEQQLKDMAQDLNGSDQKAKADAENKLKQMANDPKAAKDAQDKLQQMADKAPEGSKEKQDLQNAANQAGNMAKELAKKENTPKSGGSKIDPKDLEKAAKELASADPETKKQAMEQLKDMMKDPKSRDQAQQMLKDMADQAKSPEDKQALENAAKHAEQFAKDMAPKETPKIKPEDLKDLANKMNGKDEKASEAAKAKMQELMNDPKAREQAMKMMKEMAENAKNSPKDTEALKNAMKQAAEMAKDNPPKLDPKDMAELAKEFEKMDQKTKDDLKKKFEEAMKDEKFRDEMKKAAEERASKLSAEEKKKFDDMMRQMAGGDYKYESKPDPADPRNKLKAAELLLENFKKKLEDEGFRRDILKWTPEQEAQWIKDQEAAIAALRKQAEKSDWRTDRNVRSPIGGGPTPVKRDEKDTGDLTQGGRFAPPPGYVDPYKKATTGSSSEPKR